MSFMYSWILYFRSLEDTETFQIRRSPKELFRSLLKRRVAALPWADFAKEEDPKAGYSKRLKLDADCKRVISHVIQAVCWSGVRTHRPDWNLGYSKEDSLPYSEQSSPLTTCAKSLYSPRRIYKRCRWSFSISTKPPAKEDLPFRLKNNVWNRDHPQQSL